MKKMITIVLVLALFTGLTACKKVELIVLPDADEIEAVKITQGDTVVEETDPQWISALVEQISAGEATGKESLQDAPNAADYIKVVLQLKSGETDTLFVYKETEWYIERPYQGIYQADEKVSEMLMEQVEAQRQKRQQEAEERAAKLEKMTPTELADSLGITKENYPRIDGSTSTLPLVQLIYWQMIQPTVGIEGEWQGMPEQASKTMKSYEMLIAGDVDMILVPDASQDIEDMLEESGMELEYTPIGAEALVFITHEDNPAENITKEQVQQIYSSMEIDNWSALGGVDGRIVPICRNADAGSQAQMENLVLDGMPIAPEIEENYMERDMNSMLAMVENYSYFARENEKNAYALGYTMYYYIDIAETVLGNVKIKPLAYEGVTPTPETIVSKEYPLGTNYYAVIRKTTPKEHSARKIIDWLLTEEGQQMVSLAGLGSLEQSYEMY